MYFRLWLEQQELVTINIEAYKKSLTEKHRDLFDWASNRREKLSGMNVSGEILNQIKDYPKYQDILSKINSKTISHIDISELRKYYGDRLDYKTYRHLYDYIDSFEKAPEWGKYEDSIRQISDGTHKNMLMIKAKIEKAISQIEWNGSVVTISPQSSSGELVSTDSAEIGFGSNIGFTWFNHDGKIEIGDMLEAGDTDFFRDQKVQDDYFNLIEELRNPGSTGKILTLYTARPAGTDQIHRNIFLSNSLDHVEGLSRDLSSDKPRDIWRIKINSKYLTKTNDAGRIQYYQLTNPNFKIISQERL